MTLRPAILIQPGDMADLEGDQYADPHHTNISLQYEYAVVASVEVETPQCVAIGFEGFDVVGFPVTHPILLAD